MDSFKNISEVAVSDAIVLKTISSFRRLEELVVLSPIHQQRPSILADAFWRLLRLWGVLITTPPKWDMFPNLRSLAIVGARMYGSALDSLRACPNLSKLASASL
ncbi:hypothetical protein Bca101_065923 [Brassica carinata]